MATKIIGFIDGENLVSRYQDMLKDGRVPNDEVIHIHDVLVWAPRCTANFYVDIARISFYQTVVGDYDKLNSVKESIRSVSYKYDESEDAEGHGILQPRVFKKQSRSAKTKSVDINLTVDVMRHALSSTFEGVQIFSGDGDYLPLVEEVGRHGIQVWIYAFSKGLSKDLKNSADHFIDLDEYFFSPTGVKSQTKSISKAGSIVSKKVI
jgi:uncharacterized LabA/DUF88 family protein